MKKRILTKLVMEAKQGDQGAKLEILERFHPLLLNNIIKYFGRNQEMEDLIQEGRCVLLQAIQDYDRELGVPFEAYVQRCVFYYYVDLRKKRRELLVLDKPLKDGTRWVDLMEYDQPSMDQNIIQREGREDLYRVILGLSPKQREVILAYYFQGKSLKALAKESQLCYQALVKRKARAMTKLKEEMGI